MSPLLIKLGYLVSAMLFIVGIRNLASPATARRGNAIAALGMLLAMAATLVDPKVRPSDVWIIFSAIIVGSAIGIWLARTTKMTSMPQMVALLNGFGGAASALVATGEFTRHLHQAHKLPDAAGVVAEYLKLALPPSVGVTIYLSVIVGGVTFTGSVVAFAKLQELLTGRPITYALQKTSNLLLLVALLATAGVLTYSPDNLLLFILLNVASLALGVLVVIPIGGADMPVVISLLNSYSGVAAAFTGFVISNQSLVITGALVGASGLILTRIMCKAMNRSLANVLFGAFGAGSSGAGQAGAAEATEKGSVRSVSAEDAAAVLAYSRLVVVVPGYGLAVAQAQHQVRELADLLEKRGVEVKYAIHPVAGRMPGHMNVLLAEANVPYPQLFDMDQINPDFERTDVAIVIGANDVVNPAARNTPSSPIYGMPILDVDKAQTIIVLKRSMNPGFAGIENELFYNPKTQMLFGDAKASLTGLVQEMKLL